MRAAPPSARRGTTLLELLIVLAIVGILAALALPAAWGAADRQAARLAAREVALLLSAARQTAATTLDGAAVHFDTAAAAVRVAAAGSTVRAVDLRARYGVALAVTRDSLAYDARGLGIGAANVTVILRARQAAETLVVSRLGRLRGGP